jgi:hypothetical protein
MSYQNITLVSGATTITLPGQMVWTDRRSRNLVAQNVEIAANGAPIIEEFQQIGAYPITLVAKGAGDTWVDKAVVDQLLALADAPLASPMTLTYNDGTVITVRFRYSAGPAVEADLIYPLFPEDVDVPLTTAYSLTLRLFQASA